MGLPAQFLIYPKDRLANLAFRKKLRDWIGTSQDRQTIVKAHAAKHLLWFVNVYGWIAEQRKDAHGGVKILFLTYDYQDEALARIEAALGKKHIVGDKSRDMGFTWMVLFVFLHRWLFGDYESFGVASRTQDYVDKEGSTDSLFWKLMFALEALPPWMKPKKWKKNKGQLINYDRVNNITGYATSKDIARGGRRLAILLDELAAYHYGHGKGCWNACAATATNCIVAVSTHKGTTGAFAEACRSAKNHPEVFEHIILRWWQDPRKAEGLCVVDPAKPAPGMSEWTCDKRAGGRWSPWFERMCIVLHYDKAAIAQELEGDPNAAGYGWFSEPLLEAATAAGVRVPRHVGRLIYDRETLEPIRWQEDSNGNISLWCALPGDRPVEGMYAAGCDVSAGEGSTPSVVALIDMRLGQKVGEYADAHKHPQAFACDAMALAKWFWTAKLIWEDQGPGGRFTKTVKSAGYRKVYLRKTNEDTFCPDQTLHMGAHMSRDFKRTLFEALREALGSEYLERSEATINEYRDYRYSSDGGVEFGPSVDTEDPTKARLNHGDRALATALAWLLVKESRLLSQDRKEEARRRPPERSFAWFLEREEEARQQALLYGGLRLL